MHENRKAEKTSPTKTSSACLCSTPSSRYTPSLSFYPTPLFHGVAVNVTNVCLYPTVSLGNPPFRPRHPEHVPREPPRRRPPTCPTSHSQIRKGRHQAPDPCWNEDLRVCWWLQHVSDPLSSRTVGSNGCLLTFPFLGIRVCGATMLMCSTHNAG